MHFHAEMHTWLKLSIINIVLLNTIYVYLKVLLVLFLIHIDDDYDDDNSYFEM